MDINPVKFTLRGEEFWVGSHCRMYSENWLMVLKSLKWKSLGNELVNLTLQKSQQVWIHSEVNNVGALEDLHFVHKMWITLVFYSLLIKKLGSNAILLH